MYEAKVIEDSISTGGVRLTTFQLKYPRYIHAEFMTHRVFSRNASSSRAIPANKLVEKSLDEMVFPIRWGLNQPGMQANEQELEGDALVMAKLIWKRMAEFCADGVRELAELGLHKQWANRPLEWFGHIEVVVTATEWENFFHLRDHPDAQPEIQELARLMRQAHEESTPIRRAEDPNDPFAWHLPYVTFNERMSYPIADLVRMSTARNARVSYLTHDKQQPVIENDIALHDRLVGSEPIHASPTEHVAYPLANASEWSGNFRGWHQYRKDIEKSFK